MENLLRPVLAEQLSEAEQLYFRNRGIVCDKILTTSTLYVTDGEAIADLLAGHLPEYDGPFDDEAFVTWAIEVMQPEIDRRTFFNNLCRDHRGSVRAGIWSVLRANLDLKDDESISRVVKTIECNTWVWAWQHIDDLMVPGTAKPSTRIRATAKFQALTWRKDRLREKEKFDNCDVKGFGEVDGDVSVSSDGEISTDRILLFDPGHDGDLEDGEILDRPTAIPPPQPSDLLIAMKSGAPKLLCPVCKTMQPMSPDAASELEAVRLRCGHQRTASLAMAAK